MDETPHDVLLAMAGHVDDDLLAWTRELVAVGEDARAFELLVATLVAEEVALPARVRAAVVDAARAQRTELDAELALVPASAQGTEDEELTAHRFDPAPAGLGTSRLTAALHGVLARQPVECRTWLTWRLTPTGSAPGPLPHPVVLVETAAGVLPTVLSYQVATMLERAGTPASVEVIREGAELSPYHRAALRSARPLAAEPAAGSDATWHRTAQGSDSPRHAPPGPAEQTVPVDAPRPVPAPARAVREDATAASAPGPDPIPLPHRQRAREDGSAVPRPVPLLRRAGPQPAPRAVDPVDEPAAHPLPRPDVPAAAHDALDGPLSQPLLAPLLDPRIDEDDPLGLGEPTARAEAGADEWISGAWAVQDPDASEVAERPDGGVRHWSPPGVDAAAAAPGPGTDPAIDAAELGLRPESVARLSATDRALLARLQAELGNRDGRSGTGVPAERSTNVDPPDLAG